MIEFDLDEAVGVGADNEVDLCPVDHNDLLDVVYDVRQLAGRESLQATIELGRPKITVEDFLLMKPLGTQYFFLRGLKGVVMHKVGKNIVLLLIFRQETVMVLPVVLIHAKVELVIFVQVVDFACVADALVFLVLEEHLVVIGFPFILAEKTTARQCGDLWCWLSPNQVAVLLVGHHFSNGVGQQVRWQIANRSVAANAEASHDRVLFLVREVVQQLSEVGQLVVINGSVHWNVFLILTTL